MNTNLTEEAILLRNNMLRNDSSIEASKKIETMAYLRRRLTEVLQIRRHLDFFSDNGGARV